MKTKIPEKWTRSMCFKKHYGAVFGMRRVGTHYRLDIGDENLMQPDGSSLNISECQIIFEQEAFDALLGLLKKVNRERKKDEKAKKGGKTKK